MIDLNKRVIDLTVGELLDLLQREEKPTYVYGLRGLSEILGISEGKANWVKKSGIIDAAIQQVGFHKKIKINVEQARSLYLKNTAVYREFMRNRK
ncbi:MAG: DUF3853 family protein [Bacteroidales bacterium]|jgi:hypothetical protein|nr:DUF3853 family protein [Bacteroidales bacterium]